MPSSLPSADNDYQILDIDTKLTLALWNAVLNSVGARLRAAEAVRADFEALINLGTGQALEVISANVQPQLTALTAVINQLKADVQAAEDAVAEIVVGQVPMSMVTGLSTALGAKASQSYVDDALAAKASIAHGHLISAITGLQDALDAKAPSTHDHTIGAISGLAAALAAKADAADYARRDASNTFTHASGFGDVPLTDAATIAWDCSLAQSATVTLGGNRTLGAPTNIVDGFTYQLEVIQDATGGRTLAFNAAYVFPNGTAPTISTTANASTILTFKARGGKLRGVAAGPF